MKYLKYIIVALSLGLMSCDKFLDREPFAQSAQDGFFDSENKAQSAVIGMYRTMSNSYSYGQSLVIVPEFSARHTLHAGSYPEYESFRLHSDEENGLKATNVWLANMWQALFASVNAANSVIEGVQGMDASLISDETKSLFTGEAKFVRALNYFYLVRAFGNIPLRITATKEDESLDSPQVSPDQVYEQIIKDLTEAMQELPEENPFDGAAAKGRATYWAAAALLSKVYLYHENYAESANLARQVIESGAFSLVADYSSIWQDQNTSESIFELQFDDQVTNALAAVSNDNASMLFYADSATVDELFEDADKRKGVTLVSGSRNRLYIGKFPNFSPASQNLTMIRLSEIYLIHAEAQARVENSVSQASYASLKIVQDRAEVTKSIETYANLTEYIKAIQEEKERELMFEGETWFDFCRTGLAQEKFETVTSENYYLYAIPAAQLNLGEGMTQNDGY